MTLPFLAYMLACLAVGFVLTICVSMFRSTKNDDFKSWYWIAGFSLLTGLTPYLYHEHLTRKWSPTFTKPVASVLSQAKVAGKVAYFRVVSVKDSTAKVVVIANEKGQFGEPERTVLEVEMENRGDKWAPKKYSFINSFKRQKDSTTMPPYW